jgi:Zn ribbon nucleic-acid-binding protein
MKIVKLDETRTGPYWDIFKQPDMNKVVCIMCGYSARQSDESIIGHYRNNHPLRKKGGLEIIVRQRVLR